MVVDRRRSPEDVGLRTRQSAAMSGSPLVQIAMRLTRGSEDDHPIASDSRSDLPA